MKKPIKMLIASFLMVPVFALNACVVGITCISHIDRDENGKCDNCNQKVVIEVSNVESIVVKTMPIKTYYAVGEALDLTGASVTVTYNDGTPAEDIPLSDARLVVNAPNMNSMGKKNVSVYFGGKTVLFAIEVGAARFNVTFDLGYDAAETIPEQLVTINECAQKPENPQRAGYDFVDWYTDETLTTVYNFELNQITNATVIYAKWAEKFTVTYDLNYEGSQPLIAQTVNGIADATIEPEARDGFTFAGWYVDAEGSAPFSFDQIITENITVYAYWVSDATTMYTVTFSENYGENPATTQSTVAEGAQVATPSSPSRSGVATKGHQVTEYVFGGWYTDAACTTAYDFEAPVNGDITLYAKWTGTYIFEAEHVSFMDRVTGQPIQGMGASGGSVGPNMVDSPTADTQGINASNGFYVTYLYAPGLGLYFDIQSDRAVSDATLVFRISAEAAPFALTLAGSDNLTDNGTRISSYRIALNDNPIEYEMIEIIDTTGHTSTGGKRPFSDFTIAVNLSLKEGLNTFEFITTNMNGMGGTMAGTAPVIDCIKVTTSAELTWDPITDNEFGQ